ncbi:MAG: gliding motility-associated C-terminal domain-containing protein [Saprospiraceae bacterium]
MRSFYPTMVIAKKVLYYNKHVILLSALFWASCSCSFSQTSTVGLKALNFYKFDKELQGNYPIAISNFKNSLSLSNSYNKELDSSRIANTDNCLSGHEADIWYLSDKAIKWINDTPTVIGGFKNNPYEVMASVCDQKGDLLLYSDGDFIYNKYNEKLAAIYTRADPSSSMFLILTQPGNDSIYYVFHPQATEVTLKDSIFNLYFTIINVKANLMHGSVVKFGQLLLTNSSEKVTGINHCNGIDWWILGLRANDEAFHSWVLSDTGINVASPVISYSGSVHQHPILYEENQGWLKPSHDGNLLIEVSSNTNTYPYGAMEIHKFNTSSGKVYNGMEIIGTKDKLEGLYSVEWSPTLNKIYFTGFNRKTYADLFQMDVSIYDSTIIRESLLDIASTKNNIGSPILGKDGKIYITNFGGIRFLHVIHNPNLSGNACDFRLYEFPLGGRTSLGAPLFASGFQFPFKLYVQGPTSICNDTIARYILNDLCPHPSVEWRLYEGGEVVRENLDTIEVYYRNKGNYRISASYSTECGVKSDTIKVQVEGCHEIKKDNCLTGHEADIWYLSAKAIKWINDTPTVISGFYGLPYEVMASICDRNGDLLIYSDGISIYNKYHEIVKDIYTRASSSSSMSLILQQPGSDSLYYVFHPEENYVTSKDTTFNLYYTIINVLANAGHCSVVSFGNLLMKNSSEKVAGIRHCNGRDWWIVGLRSRDEAFHSWVLSDTGINVSSPIISYSGKLHPDPLFPTQNVCWLKPSHDGSRLIEITSANNSTPYGTMELHKFDARTGIISDGIEIIERKDKLESLYSVEWSPDLTKIYFRGFNRMTYADLFQMDVSVYDSALIRSSLKDIASTKNNIGSPILGKDGKIYITNFAGKPYLHVIHNPNLSGNACDFRLYEFPLGGKTSLGAPLFASGFQFPFKLYVQGPTSICNDTIARYILNDLCPHPSVEWRLYEGGEVVRENLDTIEVYYRNKGNYRISASYPTECGVKSDTINIEVQGCHLQKEDTCPTGNEVNIWYPSCDKVLNFKNISPVIDSGYGGSDWEACNSICDRNGNILFYSDNEDVYDRTHKPIKGSGSNYTYVSATMSLILPKPNSDSIYYWITPDAIKSSGSFKETKMFYHVINMNRNGGLGEIVQTKLILMDTSSERVTAVRHCNGKDWWIVGENALDERLFVWLLDETGINLIPNQVYDAGFRRMNNNFGIGGQMKFNPDGSVLAEHNYQINGTNVSYYIGLHKFDPSTGLFYNSLNINYPDKPTFYHYGLEFSASGRFLYLSELNVNQFDLKYWDADSISNSKVSLGKLPFVGAPSLCKDGKIYHTTSTPYVSIIKNPERKGSKCNLDPFAMNLGPNRVATGSPTPARGLMWPYRTFIKGEYEACPDSVFTYYISDPCKHDPPQWTMLDSAVLKTINGIDTVQIYFPKPGVYRIASAYPARCGYKSDTVSIEVVDCICNTVWKSNFTDTTVCANSNLNFKFTSNQEVVNINQKYYNSTDSIVFKNLQSDVLLQIHLERFFGCDTNFQYRLKVIPDTKSTSEKVISCYGDSILIQGKYYFKSDTIVSRFSFPTSCDSLHTVYLKFSTPPSIITKNFNLCFGDSIGIGNNWYSKDTNLIFRYKGFQLCDSFVEQFNINIDRERKSIERNFFCEGDSLLYNGYWIHKDTSFNKIIPTNYCDSMHQIIFKVYPNIAYKQNYYRICNGDSLHLGNTWRSYNGNYENHYSSTMGCDSLVFDSLFVFAPLVITNENYSICEGDSIFANNRWYKDSIKEKQIFSNVNGCDSIHEIIIKLKEKPESRFINFTLCFGDSIIIENVTYKISSEFSIQKSNAQDICDSLIYYSIHVEDEIKVELPSFINVYANEAHILTPTYSSGITQYEWKPDLGLSCTDCPNPEFNYSTGGEYTLVVTDINGCTAIAMIDILVRFREDQIYFPNVFSPNGDIINDTWKPINYDPDIKFLSLNIYSNWGALVYSSDSYFEWDGKLNGKELNPHVFVYVLEWMDSKGNKKLSKGDITLVR